MLTLLKKIFTWWNQDTFGTRIKTIFFGKFVGEDEFGNKYYKNSKNNRWVIYKAEINASKITSDWFSWMHHTTNTIPSSQNRKKYFWQKPHKDNKTGSKKAYKPNKITNKPKEFQKYETWKPK